ncbi:N-6 DNA methylase [Leptospira licerasiae]|uniref:N-6 DNA methylase n=1 Tax=Leptospira licerasiae TaxID=447106 RepID=UPI001AF01C14|nr:N-6 DNA methylase [Leptospira licerasiae]
MNSKKPSPKKSPSSGYGKKGPAKSGSSFSKPTRSKNSSADLDSDRKPYRSKERGDSERPYRSKDGNSKPGYSSDKPKERGGSKPFRSGNDRNSSARSGNRKFSDEEKKPFRDKDSDRGDRKPFSRSSDRGERKPYSRDLDRGERKPFSGNTRGEGRNSYGENSDRGDRKPFSRSSDRGERKPYSRDSDRGDRKPFSRDSSRGDRKPFSRDSDRGERKPFSGNTRGEGRNSYGENSDRGDRKPFSRSSDRGERKPYSRDSDRGDRKPYSRDSERGERKPFSRNTRGEGRNSYGENSNRGDRKPFSGNSDRGERKPFSRDSGRGERKPFSPRGKEGFRSERPTRSYEEDNYREGIRAGWQSAKLSLSEFDRPEALTYHASCGDGLAFLLKEEVIEAGLEILSDNRGGVFFKGPSKKVRDFCLSSGISSGISFELSSWQDIQGPDDLYEVAAMFPFEKLLSPGTKFRIDAATKDSLQDSRYATYRLKDAIFDRFRAQGLELPEADREEPEVLFYLRSRMNQVKLFLALHAQPLQRRGHGREGGEAPLRETLAQALLRFSGWKPGEALYDPFCGSGTLLIEAALRMRNGGWVNYKSLSRSSIFTRLFGPCKAKEEWDSKEILLFGSDISEDAIELAKKNAKEAGVADLIRWKVASAEEQDASPGFKEGKIVTNPPYGVRLGDKESVSELYSSWGESLKKNFSGSYVALVAGDPSLLGFLKLKSDKEQSVTIAKLKGKLVAYRID